MKKKQVSINDIRKQRPYINNVSLKYLFFKRLFDIVISLLAILFLSLILLTILVWIRIRKKEAALYYEEKYGLRGKRYRIYVFKKIIKKTAIRKLPLLFNILKGNMSFVGPQPASAEDISFEPWHNLRLLAKPGITGLWQVSGKKGGANEMVRMDLKYIRERSLIGDLKILLKAICLMFAEKGPLIKVVII